MYPGRTTEDLVKGIIEVDAQAWPDISPFIDAANEMVTELCATVTVNADGTGPLYYNDHRLEVIERWLSAHFYALADQQVEFEKVSSLAQKYQVKIDIGLDQTKYGQMAMRLDTRGRLASINNIVKDVKLPRKVGVTYLGKSCPSQRTGYGPYDY